MAVDEEMLEIRAGLDAAEPTNSAIAIWKMGVRLDLRDMLQWAGHTKSIPLVTEPTKGPLHKVVAKRSAELFEAMNKSARATNPAFGVYPLEHKPMGRPDAIGLRKSLEQYEGDAVIWRFHTNTFKYGGMSGGKVLPGMSKSVDTPPAYNELHVAIIGFPDESQRTGWEISR